MAVDKYNLGNIRDATGKGFRSYGSYEEGAQDQMRLLGVYQNKHNLNTLSGIINRWAPPTENNTSNYLNVVSQITGIKPDQEIDLNDPVIMGKVAHAMARMEKGSKNVPLSEQQYIDLATKRTANPVSQLSQPKPNLQGAALLQATGGQAPDQTDAQTEQAQQQAITNQVNGAAMMTPDQQEQVRTKEELEAMRKAQEEQRRKEGLSEGALGLASLLYGAAYKNSNTVSKMSTPGMSGIGYSAPTQQALQGIRSFNNY